LKRLAVLPAVIGNHGVQMGAVFGQTLENRTGRSFHDSWRKIVGDR
jgi:hypothetical protein